MDNLQKVTYLVGAVRKHFKLILFLWLIGTIGTVVINLFVFSPKYGSSVQMVVQAENDDVSNSVATINGNVLMVNTYKDLIKGDVVLDEVQKELKKQGLNMTTDQINQSLQITQSPNSQMFMIKSVSDTPREASVIVNTTAEVFKEKATDMLKIKQVTISSYGKEDIQPTAPKVKLNIFLGATISVFIGVMLALILEALADKVKGRYTVEEELGLPLLGLVSFVK